MSIKIRKYKRGGWEVDITFKFPDGTPFRRRLKSPHSTKTLTKEWGENTERSLYKEGPPQEKKPIPTLEEFSKSFMEDHVGADQHKPSGVSAKESIFRVHLIPFFGEMRLNEISSKDIQGFKKSRKYIKRKDGTLKLRSRKSLNNILSVLKTTLNKATEWGVIDQAPCRIPLLKPKKNKAHFFSFEDFERLIVASRSMGSNELLTILLGGEAGLRCGEIMALRWSDVDFHNRLLTVRRSIWKEHETAPKSGNERAVPMTIRLAKALAAHRHLISDRVLVREDGSDVSQKLVRSYVLRSCKLAQIEARGPHTLRHTFCSHLAMKGAPVIAIKDAAGHSDLATTMRYMHLSPNAVTDAIRLLDQPSSEVEKASGFGDI